MTLIPGLITLLFFYSAKVTAFGENNGVIMAISYFVTYFLLMIVTKMITFREMELLSRVLKRRRGPGKRPRQTLV